MVLSNSKLSDLTNKLILQSVIKNIPNIVAKLSGNTEKITGENMATFVNQLEKKIGEDFNIVKK